MNIQIMNLRTWFDHPMTYVAVVIRYAVNLPHCTITDLVGGCLGVVKVKKKSSDVCSILRSSPVSTEVPLFCLVTADLAAIGR